MKKVALFFTTMVLLGACASNETADSSSVKQSEIYQDYTLSWDGDEGEWNAHATYRFAGENGTTLRLSEPSKITFNGVTMSESKLLFGGATYRQEGKKWPSTGLFEFTDTDGKSYKNSVAFTAIDFARPVQEASKTGTIGIPLTRDITATDEIFLHVSDTSAQSEKRIRLLASDPAAVVKYDPEEQLLLIEPAFFEKMADVELSMWMIYERTEDLAEATAKGGEVRVTYTSHTLKFKRKD